MATAFHFLRENILSPLPDLEPDEELWTWTTPGSSPSSISAVCGTTRARRGLTDGLAERANKMDECVHQQNIP
ncbi:hypothetical protein NHX12_008654 [Muraenolepis orangiensis]|uniref:Uncharacterized protein n=1 Tax=Muraenolepis orangiensis TaxID=630683 RepID=A0A9Q0DP96_9TELE|nr:hypothetical protein NHX12_008654 [Muraenolepis orangiensis]